MSAFEGPDVPELIKALLNEDEVLKAITGLDIDVKTKRQALHATSEAGSNQRIVIYRDSLGRYEWTAGGAIAHRTERIGCLIVTKSTEEAGDARALKETIRKRTKRIILSEDWNGTGVMWVNEADDKEPSAASTARAVHILAFDFNTTSPLKETE